MDPAAEPDDAPDHDGVDDRTDRPRADEHGADSAAEGVEHLQAAARELLAAARSFLDVVERVVEDPDRLGGAASSMVDLVRDGVGAAGRAGSRLEPWEQAAWSGAASWDEHDDEHDEDAGVEDAGVEHAAAEDPVLDDAGPALADDDESTGSGAVGAPSTARRRSRNGASAGSRVRRISVD